MSAYDPDAPRESDDGLPLLPPGLDPHARHRDDDIPVGRKRKRAVLGIMVILGLLSTMMVVVSGIYWWKYHTFNNGLHRLPIFGAAAPNRPSRDIDGKALNILIVGNDDRETATDAELKQLGTSRDGGSLNTDTMMIVHVPANGKKAALISLPRDSWVAIEGHGMGKLNSAYPDGFVATSGSTDAKRAAGGRLLIGTIQNLTGLTLDHFVQVDLLGFYRISNAIRGVQVNMCAAVKESNSGINLKKGLNTIQGKQALAFVRQRYNFPDGQGDLDRVQRQRYFLTAAFRKLASAGTLLNPIKLQDLLSAVQSSLYLDEKINLTDLAGQLEGLSANNIVGQTIPTNGFGNADGQSIVVVTPSEVKTFVNKVVGSADSKVDAAKTVKPSSVTVDVLNAGSADGAASLNAGTLRNAGFVIGTTGNAPDESTATVIRYSTGQEAQAKTVAAYVPGATLQKVAGLKHVTLVLGSDQLDAKPEPAKLAAAAGGVEPSTAASGPPATNAAAAAAAPAAAPTTTAPAKKTPKAIDAGCIN